MTSEKQMLARAEALMAELFANGGSPMEHFGTSWDKLQALEEAVPEINNMHPYVDMKMAAFG